mmetsp:Transcript_29068/g.43826  ORF Transcript_29068/g.43826 Transcript_29068/m.43826 type:complete len:107 (+) Transcript_29068:606-926(+)
MGAPKSEEYGLLDIGESQILERQDFTGSSEQTVAFDSRREPISIDSAKMQVLQLRFQPPKQTPTRSSSISRSMPSDCPTTDDASAFEEQVKEFWKEDKHAEMVFRS